MMGKPITMDQLRQDVGNMVEKITKVIAIFRQFQLKMEEYVCLKVIAMVSQDGKKIAQNKYKKAEFEILLSSWSLFWISVNNSFCLILDLDDPSLSVIHDKYLTCLRTFTKKHFPNQPNRVEELLVRLPEVSSLSWNEYLWFHGLTVNNVLSQNHLNYCLYYVFTGQESCLSFVGVQNVLRAILIELVGWIISPTMSVTDRVIDPNLQYWRPPRYVISYHQRCSLSHLHTNYSKTLKEWILLVW